MTWSFETSLLVFLALAAASQALAVATRSALSLPFALGALCVAGFALGLFPADLITKSKMREVGFIAFNVLVVHSGTLLDVGKFRANKGATLTGLIAALALALVLGLGAVPLAGRAPLLGREATLLTIGPVIGGGAANAIASNLAARLAPGLVALPWLVFMAQGFFGLPLFVFALKKAAKEMASAKLPTMAAPGLDGPDGRAQPDAGPDKRSAHAYTGRRRPICEWVPERYRSTAYYLAALMLVAVINRWLYGMVLRRLGLHPALSGLLLGALFARLGLLERDPLVKSGSFNFLMLGLMALMADTMAATPFRTIMALIPPTLLALAIGTVVVGLTGFLLGKRLAGGRYRGLAIAAGCMISMPPPTLIAKGILRSSLRDEAVLRSAEAGLLAPIGSAWILVNGVASIVLASLAGILL